MSRALRLSPVLLVLLLALPARAEDELTGEQIAARISRGNGFTWEGARTRLRMVLIDEKDRRRERVMDVLGRRHAGHLQTVVRFRSPPDVAGTAFLMLEKEGGRSEQYIYLPGLKRTRRIAGREQEGSFMGSDFTYADLQPGDPRSARHKRLPDEDFNGTPTYVVESVSKEKTKGGYSKLRTWVRKSDFVPLRTRFYDAAGKPTKTLYARRVRTIDGRPVVMEARMQSETGRATVLVVESIEKQDTLPDSEFTPTALDRQ